MDDQIYKLPPIELGSQVYMASDLTDKLDWGFEVQGIEKAWVTKGAGIRIGVADTGLPNHPDLAGAIVAAQNFSASGTVDDHHGHSTHVCGTIGARENGVGVIGVAPKCEIVIAKVLGDDGSGSTESIAAGVDYLVDQGCDIISMSLGGGFSPRLKASIDRAVERGVFVICAAGNDGTAGKVGCPANLDNTIAVASYNKQGMLSDFSTRGAEVDIAFPGEDILSTYLGGAYRKMSGTSMATPFCSGLVAELLGQQRAADKAGREVKVRIRNEQDLLNQIKSAAIDKGPTGYDTGWGWGVVDTKKFLDTTAKDGDNKKSGELDLGLLRVKFPVTVDGKQGWFIYLP